MRLEEHLQRMMPAVIAVTAAAPEPELLHVASHTPWDSWAVWLWAVHKKREVLPVPVQVLGLCCPLLGCIHGLDQWEEQHQSA